MTTTLLRPEASPGHRGARGGLRGAAAPFSVAGSVLGLEFDDGQGAVLAARAPVVRVLGAPGTGKTTLALASVLERVLWGELAASECCVISSSRVAAAQQRRRLTTLLGAALQGTATQVPLVRTMASLAFGILTRARVLRGEPLPRLLSGPEQDLVLADLLAGHRAGVRGAPQWPAQLAAALGTRGFRAELREVLMRCAEHDIDAPELARLGVEHDEPAWQAAAQVLAEYSGVTALAAGEAYDPASIIGAAADELDRDPQGAADLCGRLRFIAVDDAADLTAPGARLLSALVDGGAQLLLLGDPDSAVQAFRGGDPVLLTGASFGSAVRGRTRRRVRAAASHAATPEEQTLVLSRTHRHPVGLQRVVDRVAARIGVTGGGHWRRPATSVPGVEDARGVGQAALEVAVVRGAGAQAQLIAARFLAAHLSDGLAWSDLAVITRGRARLESLRRELDRAGVPVVIDGAGAQLRDEPVVRALLTLMDLAERIAEGAPVAGGPLDPQLAGDLVTSPVGGADPAQLTALRRALRQAERAAGGGRDSGELLVAALTALTPQGAEPAGPAGLGDLAGPGGPGGPDGPGRREAEGGPRLDRALGRPVRRVAGALAAGVEHCRSAHGADAATLLWAIWSGTELAGPWQRQALAGGPQGRRADRHLDAVVALVESAHAYAERRPGRGARGFVEQLLAQDVAGDSLVGKAPGAQCVTLTTPTGAAGRSWPYVAVCDVQDGVWPDPRVRGSLLHTQRLGDVASGRAGGLRAQRLAVLQDELRLFHVAVSRAGRRLLVTAVDNEDEQPSALLDLIDPDGAQPREVIVPPRPMALPDIVADLRRDLVRGRGGSPFGRLTDPAGRASDPARVLAVLASAGVPGADPATWWGAHGPSDARPLRDPDTEVVLSPSRLPAFVACPLRWLVEDSGGRDATTLGASALGSLVHHIAATVDVLDEAALHRALDQAMAQGADGRGTAPARSWVTRREAERAHAMLARISRHAVAAHAEGWRDAGRELPIDVTLGSARIRGRVDLVERAPDGGLRVVDIKTGSSVPTRREVETHAQLAAYQAAVEAGAFGPGERSVGAALLHVGATAPAAGRLLEQAPAVADDPEGGRSWARELVEESAERMRCGTLAARRGGHCRGCPLRGLCPATGPQSHAAPSHAAPSQAPPSQAPQSPTLRDGAVSR